MGKTFTPIEAKQLNRGVEQLSVEIEYRGQTIYRNYLIEDGEVPESMKEEIEDMMDTIDNTLDNPMPF